MYNVIGLRNYLYYSYERILCFSAFCNIFFIYNCVTLLNLTKSEEHKFVETEIWMEKIT